MADEKYYRLSAKDWKEKSDLKVSYRCMREGCEARFCSGAFVPGHHNPLTIAVCQSSMSWSKVPKKKASNARASVLKAKRKGDKSEAAVAASALQTIQETTTTTTATTTPPRPNISKKAMPKRTPKRAPKTTTLITAIKHDKVKDTIATKTTTNKKTTAVADSKAAENSVASVSKKRKATESLSQPSSSTLLAMDTDDTTHTKKFKREPAPDRAQASRMRSTNNAVTFRRTANTTIGDGLVPSPTNYIYDAHNLVNYILGHFTSLEEKIPLKQLFW